MEDVQKLLSVHLCSLLAPVSLFLLNLLPGGLLGSPQLVLSLLSLTTILAALLAPPLDFLCPLALPFSPVKPFQHYVNAQLSSPQHGKTKRQRTPDVVSASVCVFVENVVLTKGGTFVQLLLGSTMLYVIVGTLLGADPFRQLLATVVWGLLMTSLTSVPAAVVLDLDLKTWRRVILDRLFVSAGERGLYVMVMSTLLGAWLGAIPIPLDWNRPWQVWPIPCACGAVMGSVLGSCYCLLAQQFSLYPPQLSLQSRWLKQLHKRPSI